MEVNLWEDAVAVGQLVLTERHARDNQQWDRMLASYHPESRVETAWFVGSGPDFVAASRVAFPRGRSKHRLAPPVVTVKGERAIAETDTVIELRTIIDDVETDTHVSIRLFNRIRRDDRVWRLASLTAIYEKDYLRPVDPSDRLALDRNLLNSFRPSYRYLSYSIHRYGHAVKADLPGDDRPETVAEIYRQGERWLAGGSL